MALASGTRLWVKDHQVRPDVQYHNTCAYRLDPISAIVDVLLNSKVWTCVQ